jgi:hypothetical protein
VPPYRFCASGRALISIPFHPENPGNPGNPVLHWKTVRGLDGALVLPISILPAAMAMRNGICGFED